MKMRSCVYHAPKQQPASWNHEQVPRDTIVPGEKRKRGRLSKTKTNGGSKPGWARSHYLIIICHL